MNRLESLRKKLEYLKGQRDQIQKNIDATKQKIKMGKRNVIRHERALEIVKQVGLLTQKQLEYHFSGQVGLAMEAVFDDPYSLKMNFQEKRGKTEVELLFKRRNLEFPPIGNVGVGHINIGSLSLRIAYLNMRRDKKVRPVLILDEPFAQLKGQTANRRALVMLREISSKLNIQVIMVSDERVSREDIIDNADRVFLVTNEGETSEGEASEVTVLK